MVHTTNHPGGGPNRAVSEKVWAYSQGRSSAAETSSQQRLHGAPGVKTPGHCSQQHFCPKLEANRYLRGAVVQDRR